MKRILVSFLIMTMAILIPLNVVQAAKSNKKTTSTKETAKAAEAKETTETAETTGAKEEKTKKVTIHLFYASWCPHCHDFIDYFSDKYAEYDKYFEIKAYLVSDTDSSGKSVSVPENSKIMEAVINHFKKDNDGKELDGGIPLIIIGKSFVQAGFGTDGQPIIDKAMEEYKNEKYEDVVQKIIKDKKLDTSKVVSFSEIASPAKTEESGTMSALVIIGIFVVLIGGFAGLVVASKK